MIPKAVFLLGLAIAASGFVSPPVALALGLIFGFTFPHPFDQSAKKLSRYLLQASVIGLGFGMNLHDVIRAGRSGFVYTVVSISVTMLVGMALGALLTMERTPAFLISTGTAICGGSAIAAVGPITGATDEQMAVSLGTVFVLNSVALLTFPAIGGRRADQACQSKNTVAVVHRFVLPGRRVQHLSARRRSHIRRSVQSGQNRPHRNALSDWQRHLRRNCEKSGTSAAAPGRNPLALDFDRFALADKGRLDCSMKKSPRPT